VARSGSKLAAIKLLHTAVWAALAGCILALPFAAVAGRYDWAWWLTAIVVAESAAIGLNRGRCPLTGVAARYTDDRSDNFDIYLPRWLARHNKLIFGSLFVAGEFVALWKWLS
jgi:hypothetical protein